MVITLTEDIYSTFWQPTEATTSPVIEKNVVHYSTAQIIMEQQRVHVIIEFMRIQGPYRLSVQINNELSRVFRVQSVPQAASEDRQEWADRTNAI